MNTRGYSFCLFSLVLRDKKPLSYDTLLSAKSEKTTLSKVDQRSLHSMKNVPSLQHSHCMNQFQALPFNVLVLIFILRTRLKLIIFCERQGRILC